MAETAEHKSIEVGYIYWISPSELGYPEKMRGAQRDHPVIPVGKVPGLEDVYFVAMISRQLPLKPIYKADAAEYFLLDSIIETTEGIKTFKNSEINNGLGLPQAARGSQLERHLEKYKGYKLKMYDDKIQELYGRMKNRYEQQKTKYNINAPALGQSFEPTYDGLGKKLELGPPF
ncbi:hypothetical protein AX14_008615 [Amanita brunnescens Koide BX004]|nr:hypothetical protein AX14_008615 [Amanita brunnescens Koide BX004]